MTGFCHIFCSLVMWSWTSMSVNASESLLIVLKSRGTVTILENSQSWVPNDITGMENVLHCICFAIIRFSSSFHISYVVDQVVRHMLAYSRHGINLAIQTTFAFWLKLWFHIEISLSTVMKRNYLPSVLQQNCRRDYWVEWIK